MDEQRLTTDHPGDSGGSDQTTQINGQMEPKDSVALQNYQQHVKTYKSISLFLMYKHGQNRYLLLLTPSAAQK